MKFFFFAAVVSAVRINQTDLTTDASLTADVAANDPALATNPTTDSDFNASLDHFDNVRGMMHLNFDLHGEHHHVDFEVVPHDETDPATASATTDDIPDTTDLEL